MIDYLDADRLEQIGRVQKFIAKTNEDSDPDWDTLRFEWRLVDDDTREILARGDFGERPELGPEPILTRGEKVIVPTKPGPITSTPVETIYKLTVASEDAEKIDEDADFYILQKENG